MARVPALDLDIVRGDDWAHMLAWVLPKGRAVSDLTFTSGSAVVTSNDAHFVAGDEGTLLTLMTAAGIADGTTILSVDSPSTATLSAAATADGQDAKATIRGQDMTGYVSWLAQLRSWEDATTIAATFDVDVTRAAYGIIVLSLASADTATLSDGGPWDLQGTTAAGLLHTRYAGAVTVHLDTTRV